MAPAANGEIDTTASPFPRTAEGAVGAAGTPAGVIGMELTELDAPVEFVAVALNV